MNDYVTIHLSTVDEHFKEVSGLEQQLKESEAQRDELREANRLSYEREQALQKLVADLRLEVQQRATRELALEKQVQDLHVETMELRTVNKQFALHDDEATKTIATLHQRILELETRESYFAAVARERSMVEEENAKLKTEVSYLQQVVSVRNEKISCMQAEISESKNAQITYVINVPVGINVELVPPTINHSSAWKVY